MDGCGSMTCVGTLTASLCQDNLYTFVVDIVVDGAGGIRTATNASHENVGIVAPNLLL